jgi:hypothetical protein
MESKVLIKTQKIKIGEQFINFTESKLESSNPEKVLILAPGSIGENFCDFSLFSKNKFEYF